MTAQSFVPGPDTSRALRDALGTFATGVTIVTAGTAQGPVAIIANSFASVSLDPPLVLWSPARASGRFAAFAAARHFAVHVLGVEQRDLMQRFARAGEGFDLPGITRNAQDVPLLPDFLARFECETAATHDGGDHLVVIGRVSHVTCRAGNPLVFAGGRFGRFEPDA